MRLTKLDFNEAETLVGRKHHKSKHFVRIDKEKDKVYVLHSLECIDAGTILTCEYSQTLEKQDWDALHNLILRDNNLIFE